MEIQVKNSTPIEANKRDPRCRDNNRLSKPFCYLFYTSHTLAVQELKDRYEPCEEAKHLSMADRVDRLDKVRKSLPGLTIDSWLEPSHSLVDKAVSFAEEQCLGPLELSMCTSRESEMRSEKRDPIAFKIEGVIKVSKMKQEILAETSSDLQVRTCVQRRALAYQMASLATFTTLDKVISRLFSYMMRPVLPGQRPVTFAQVMEADKTLWVLVAQRTRGQVLTSLPVHSAVEALLDSPEVTYCLMPRVGAPMPQVKHSQDSSAPRSKRRRLAKQNAKARAQPDASGPAKGGKSASKGLDLPTGAKTRDDQARPICFRCNRKSCDKQNERCCGRGQRICWYCLKAHPGADHKAD